MCTFELFTDKLLENGLQEVAVTLQDQEIDSATLKLLTEDMLDKMEIRPLGKRLKVLNILNGILEQENYTSVQIVSEDVLLATRITTPPGLEFAPKQLKFDSPLPPSKSPLPSVSPQPSQSPLPTPLSYPKYSRLVLNAEETGTILLHRAQLIRETSRYFLSLKHDLSNEYDSISMHLLKRFPDLKDAITLPGSSCNYTKLKKDLAQSVRNHKRLAKKRKNTVVDNAKDIGILLAEELENNDMPLAIDSTLLARTLSELKKESEKNKPSKEHIKQLLSAITENFRDFIKTMPTIATILESYPVLTKPCWMIFQASLVLTFPDFEMYVQGKMHLLFDSIHNLMVGDYDADEELTQTQQLDIVQYMESHINKKKNTSVFNMIQPGTSLESSIINAPCILTTTTGSGIDQAFVYVDGVLMCELVNPTVIMLLTLWLATHYVLNIQYGKETHNVAMVLEDCVLMDKGQNSIQNLQRGQRGSNKGKAKSRKICRNNQLQTFYGRLKAAGLNFDI